MATSSTEPEVTDGPSGVDLLHRSPISLSVWRAPSASVAKAGSFPERSGRGVYRIDLQFTPADHASLADWVDDTGHGYDRVAVEQGMLEDGFWAGYALIYGAAAWSTWGVMRRGDHLEVWRCANGKTVGRHAQMSTALASLPHASSRWRKLAIDNGR